MSSPATPRRRRGRPARPATGCWRRPASGRSCAGRGPPEPRSAHRRQSRPHRRRALARHADDRGRRRALPPQHEVEAELKGEGTEADLAAIAGALQRDFALTPQPLSKFERAMAALAAAPAPGGLLTGRRGASAAPASRGAPTPSVAAPACCSPCTRAPCSATPPPAPTWRRARCATGSTGSAARASRSFPGVSSRRLRDVPRRRARPGCARRRAARRRADDGRHRPGEAGGGREPLEQEIASQGKARPQALTGADGGRRGGRQDDARRGAGGGATGGGATGGGASQRRRRLQELPPPSEVVP